MARTFTSGPWFMRVTALADDILRVRAAAAEDLPEERLLAVPEKCAAAPCISASSKVSMVSVFQTAALACESNARRAVDRVDLAGHVISADAPTGAVDRVGSGSCCARCSRRQTLLRFG